MRSRRALIALALTSAIALGACGNDESAGGTDVDIRLVAFKPDAVTVEAGATVTWTQHDPGAHTVTSGTVEQGTGGVTTEPNDRFDSGELATDETFRFTFADPGTYSYFCAIHPATMRGRVEVS